MRRQTYHDRWRGVRRPVGHLVEPCALLLYVALVAIALQHRLAHRTAARPTAARGVLEARLQTVPALDGGRWRRRQVWNTEKPPAVSNNICIFFSLFPSSYKCLSYQVLQFIDGTYGGWSDSPHSRWCRSPTSRACRKTDSQTSYRGEPTVPARQRRGLG